MKAELEASRKYVVGAYPASAAHSNWNSEFESQFFDMLVSDSRIRALELPWLGSIHPHDDTWLYDHFPDSLSAIITDIPHVMSRLTQIPEYGIASKKEVGRLNAISDLQKLNQDIKNFNDKRGKQVVSVIEIHTAPRNVGNVNSLAKSLDEISKWNWDGAKLAIEHCDAAIDGQQPEKGFLRLNQEIDAIQLSGARFEIFINWGRSAIEFRDANRVIEHIAMARQSGFLSGLIFSGASDQQGIFGPAWVDAHNPFQKSELHIYGDPNSLLTENHAVSAISEAGPIAWPGIKLSWLKSVDGSAQQRYTMISSALHVLDKAYKSI